MVYSKTLTCSANENGIDLIVTFQEIAHNANLRTSTIRATLTLHNKNTHKGDAYEYKNNNGVVQATVAGVTKTLNGKAANYNLKPGSSVSLGAYEWVYAHGTSDAAAAAPTVAVSIRSAYPSHPTTTASSTLTLTRLSLAPSAVTGLTITRGAAKTVGTKQVWPITLNWTDPGTGALAKTFNIYRGTSSTNLVKVATVTNTGAIHSYVDQSIALQPATSYDASLTGYGPVYYRVESVTTGGTAESAVVEGYLPSPPVDKALVTTNASGQPVISWVVTSPYASDAAITYDIVRYDLTKQSDGTYKFVVAKTFTHTGGALGTAMSYTDTTAVAGTVSAYYITTMDSSGKGRGSYNSALCNPSKPYLALGTTPSAPNVSIQQYVSPSVVNTGVSHLTLQANEGSVTQGWTYNSIASSATGTGIEPLTFVAQYSLDNASWSTLPLSDVTATDASTVPSPIVTADFNLTGLADGGQTVWLRFAVTAQTVSGLKQSDWTVTNALLVVAPPVPTILDPADGTEINISDPTITWSFYSPNGADQQSAVLTFDPQDGSQPLSYTIDGPDTQFTLPLGALQTGHTYTTSLDVYDTQGLTSLDNDTAVVTYDVVYLPPGPATLLPSFDADSGVVTITMLASEPVSGIYDPTDTMDLYRQELDGSWTKIASQAASGDSYTDALAPVGTTVYYQASSVTEDGMTTYAEPVPVTVTRPEWFYFSYYDDQGLLTTLRAHGDLVLGRKPVYQATTFQVAGRKLPVVMYGTNMTEEIDVTASLDFPVLGLNGEASCVDPEALSSPDSEFYNMFAASPIMCFRGCNVDGTSVKAWGLLTANSVQSAYPENTSQGVGFAALSITLQRIDFDESVSG